MRWGVVAGLCTVGAAALAAAVVEPGVLGRVFGGSQAQGTAPAVAAAVAKSGGGHAAGRPGAVAGGSDEDRRTYIVTFREPAVVAYQGEVAGIDPLPRRKAARGKSRPDVRSPQGRQYARYLGERQAQIERGMSQAIGRRVEVSRRFQHAVNGMVLHELADADIARIRRLPDVEIVDEYREYPLDTDTGPLLIGAPAVWSGTNPGATTGLQGEGIVFGILDTGINFGSPSFSAVDPIDGYVHTNPLGSGAYLGTCAPGGVDEGRCNDKLIGGYDFVCGAPVNACTTGGLREEPGFGDTNGHGSHVASTAAGNKRDVPLLGNTRRISGVAPRGNIVAFDVCYTNVSTGQGSCPNVSAVAAVDRAIADGIVDVINFSVGGGASPWTETVSLAFLNASDAGIFVAASAGNSGPAANTLGHVEPWVSSTAMAQHGRGDPALILQVTGPQPVPTALQVIELQAGSGGVAHSATIPGTTPLRVSSGLQTATDGCAAWPAGTFTGAIAVVRRGTCSFSIKADFARDAGAIAVVIANNAAGAIIPSVPGTTIPVFGMLQADADALRTFVTANPAATAGVPYPAIIMPNTPDVLSASSSRGPAGEFDLLKPDVTAPGVRILAAVSGTTLTGSENAVELYNGTSMASPHQAGAAGLVRQANPGWTPAEVKSALAMTAERTVLLEDGVTPANAHAGGSGRIRVDRAIRSGLVMPETTAKYLAANPATGGDPATLNQPNMIRRSCDVQCSFVRQFRSTSDATQTYTIRVEGLSAAVTPSTLRIAAGATATVRVTVNSNTLPANGQFNYGRLMLVSEGTPRRPGSELHLPIAIAVQPPKLTLPELVSLTLKAGRSGQASTSIGNTGGSVLRYNFANSGWGGGVPLAQRPSTGVSSGFRATYYTNPATAGSAAQLAADDFTISSAMRVSTLDVSGFTVSNQPLASVSPFFVFAIEPDAGGLPAGDPLRTDTAVWTYVAPLGSPGLVTRGTEGIALDLAAANQVVELAPGRYWLTVVTYSAFADRFAWYGSNTGDGSFASLTIATNGSGAWASNPSFAGLTMAVTGEVACGAPWIGAATPTMGTVAAGRSQATSLQLIAPRQAGVQEGYYCIASNDPAAPRKAGRVRLTVTP